MAGVTLICSSVAFTATVIICQWGKIFKTIFHNLLLQITSYSLYSYSLFTRTNIFARRFAKCLSVVKIALFTAYCICQYDAGLWSRYEIGSQILLQ